MYRGLVQSVTAGGQAPGHKSQPGSLDASPASHHGQQACRGPTNLTLLCLYRYRAGKSLLDARTSGKPRLSAAGDACAACLFACSGTWGHDQLRHRYRIVSCHCCFSTWAGRRIFTWASLRRHDV